VVAYFYRFLPVRPISRSLLETLFSVVPDRSHGDEVAILCPCEGCPDRTGNRSVNLKTSATSCWRCSKGFKDVRTLATSLGHVIDEDQDVGPRTVGAVTQLLHDITRRKTTAPGFVAELPRPAGWRDVSEDGESVYDRLAAKMAVRKKLDARALVDVGCGVVPSSPRWEPYVIFPIVEWGRMVYWQGRTYRDRPGETTKRFCDERDGATLGARYWIYNLDELRTQGGVALVVESILNVLSLRRELAARGITGVVPVALFKHAFSPPQLTKILACQRVTEVSLMFDPDATNTAWASARKLTSQVPVTICTMPVGVDANDDAARAVDQFLARKRHTPLNSLLASLG
jgi:hypothetical protein